MPAVKTNLTIEQGSDFTHGWLVSVDGQPIDETWTAKAQVRSAAGAPGDPLHEFSVTVTSAGAVVIDVDAAVSEAWTWSTGFYDVRVTSPDGSVRLRTAEGLVVARKQVTR